MKLRTRLGVAAAILVATVGIGGWFVLRITASEQRQQLDRRMDAVLPMSLGIVRSAGGRLPSFPSFPSPAPSGVSAASDPANPLIDVYMARVLVDGTREVLVSPSSVTGAPEVPQVDAGARSHDFIVTVPSVGAGPRWRAVSLLAPGGSERLVVAISLASADATASKLRLAVWLVGAVLLAGLAAAGWWIVRLGLRPIGEVAAAADAISAGDRLTRVPVRAPRTEAGQLATAFNVMLDERQANDDRLRRFVSDASHELRTPVAAVRGFSDLYRNGGLTEPGQLDEAMRRIGGEGARMAGLVDDLLLLARLDEGRPLERAPVDLSVILSDAALDAGATHPTRQVTTDVAPGLIVEGDEARLRQVIGNLVTNALTHAGGDVIIRGRRDSANCVIEVADRGPGMSSEDGAHAFDRFWRGDPSRQRSTSGSGLGLSIVAAIVHAHHGLANISSQPGQGTTVRVVLPAH